MTDEQVNRKKDLTDAFQTLDALLTNKINGRLIPHDARYAHLDLTLLMDDIVRSLKGEAPDHFQFSVWRLLRMARARIQTLCRFKDVDVTKCAGRVVSGLRALLAAFGRSLLSDHFRYMMDVLLSESDLEEGPSPAAANRDHHGNTHGAEESSNESGATRRYLLMCSCSEEEDLRLGTGPTVIHGVVEGTSRDMARKEAGQFVSDVLTADYSVWSYQDRDVPFEDIREALRGKGCYLGALVLVPLTEVSTLRRGDGACV